MNRGQENGSLQDMAEEQLREDPWLVCRWVYLSLWPFAQPALQQVSANSSQPFMLCPFEV